MSDLSHHSQDLSDHPDVSEMRARYARVLDGPKARAVAGALTLTGLYLAVSGWVVHFDASNRALTTTNLVLGIAVALLGIGLSVAPDRMPAQARAAVPAGVFLVISPWVVTAGHHASAGMIWNNVLIGALSCVLAMTAAGLVGHATDDGPARRRPAHRY
ncbi:SPW repeat protein [Kitasatospora sp. NPDC089797]|uniref:SPW repeat protein n=1 Tax=Kitasatospora sp. NPDC089797 TaxID=3155298 RepID=UPI003431B328